MSTGDITLNRAVGLATLAGIFFTHVSQSRKTRLIIDKFDALFLVFFFILILSVLVNGITLRTQGQLWEYLMGYLLFFLLRNTIGSREKMRTVLWVIWLVTLPIVITVLQSVIASSGEGYRYEGIRGVNAIGIYCFIGIWVALWLVSEAPRWLKILLLISVPLFFSGMLVSGNRSGFLALIVASVVYVALSKKLSSRVSYILLMTAMIIGVGYFISPIAPRPIDRLMDISYTLNIGEYVDDIDKDSVDRRVFLDRAAWNIFLDNPILGTGFGSFSELFRFYSPFTMSRSVAHNLFLSIMSEVGLFGIIGLIAIYANAFGSLLQARSRLTHSSRLRDLNFVLGLLIGVNVIHASLHAVNITRLMFVVFAMAAIIVRLNQTFLSTLDQTPDSDCRVLSTKMV